MSIQIRSCLVLRVGLHHPDITTSPSRRIERVAKWPIGQPDSIDQDGHLPPSSCRLPEVRHDHHGTGCMLDEMSSGATLEQADRPRLVGIRSDHDGASFSTEPIESRSCGAADDRGLQRRRQTTRVHVFDSVFDHLLCSVATSRRDVEPVRRAHGRRGYDIRVDESKGRIPSLRLFQGVVQDGGVLLGDSCDHRCVVTQHVDGPPSSGATSPGPRRHHATGMHLRS